MAKLPDETLTIIFTLQRQLVEGIDEAAATEKMIFEQFGEIEFTVSDYRTGASCPRCDRYKCSRSQKGL